MAWKIEFEANAAKDLRRLDRKSVERILRFLHGRTSPLENPRAIGEALHGPLKAYWKYRVGDFRVIANIDDQTVRIMVLRVGNRKDVYLR